MRWREEEAQESILSNGEQSAGEVCVIGVMLSVGYTEKGGGRTRVGASTDEGTLSPISTVPYMYIYICMRIQYAQMPHLEACLIQLAPQLLLNTFQEHIKSIRM